MKTCSKEGCGRKCLCKGLCSKHYERYRSYEATDRKKCSVDGCTGNSIAFSLCRSHYTRYRNTGSPTSYNTYTPNLFQDNNDGTHTIVLRNRQGDHVGDTIIDSFNLPLVVNHKWYLDWYGYAISKIYGKNKGIHQLIFPVPKGYVIDHVDRNPLNNLISNLRKCIHSENIRNSRLGCRNTSGFIGVSYQKRALKWTAKIKIDSVQKHIGYFQSKEAAIIARLQSEKEYFGDFAPQRHLFSQYGIV